MLETTEKTYIGKQGYAQFHLNVLVIFTYALFYKTGTLLYHDLYCS